MKIKLVDVDNRLSIKYNKVEGVHNWGDDNAYPSLVKSLIGSSVTAKQCVDINSKYIYGKGFNFTQSITDKTSLIINKKGWNINQLLRLAAREFSEQNNLFIHVNYNALFEVKSVDLISSEKVRIGEADSTGYAGKFIVYNNWDKSLGKKIEKKNFLLIDKFNPDPTIIEKQVEAAGGWNKYNGQVLHVLANLNDIYSLSDIDSVIVDADSQYKAAEFKNGILRKGFIGTKLFITKPFNDPSETEAFENTIKDLQGVENIGVLHLEVKEESDSLADELLVQNIDSNIDDKMFESTEKSAKQNIIDAFFVPSILVNNSDNSIFGNSGELLKQAKLTHWENKEEERNTIIEAFELIFSNFHKPINPSNNWDITPIIQITQASTTPTNE